jgi:hypothetical protein
VSELEWQLAPARELDEVRSALHEIACAPPVCGDRGSKALVLVTSQRAVRFRLATS